MIDLTFGDSAAGALKLAKSTKRGEKLQGAVAVLGGTAEERREALRARPRRWSGETMEGSASDVAPLTLALDVGDFSDLEAGMGARRAVLEDLFRHFPGASGVTEELWTRNLQTLARLREAAETSEPVRAWVCACSPAELCGLLFLCHLLSDAGTPLSLVQVPPQVERDGAIVQYRGTGDIPPECFGALAREERAVGPPERMAYMNTWSGLARENAPLRAVVNGCVMSVPESFYDPFLKANMPAEGDFVVARVLGKTLNQVPGVGDGWLFLRLRAMAASDELTEVSSPADDHPYSGVMRRSR